MKRAIIGTVGVPARYGGFETLAENLVQYHANQDVSGGLTVYCSADTYPERAKTYGKADLRYSRFNANGTQSVIYDIVTALDAVRRGHDVLLVLGVSGAIILPLIKLFSRKRIVTNVDGIEWRREKWQGIAKHFLRWSEKLAVRHSDVVIADNRAIAEYLQDSYGITAEVIAYGGDHAIAPQSGASDETLLASLPAQYALSLCRIEPENNVEMILSAMADSPLPLVFVGNWNNSAFGREMKRRFGDTKKIHLVDPVYHPATLLALRQRASIYAHGHSAGGTNPSLVEMMHFGIPILAYDCNFNRHTTEDQAAYFKSANDLAQLMASDPAQTLQDQGSRMLEIARREYTWDIICKRYFDLVS